MNNKSEKTQYSWNRISPADFENLIFFLLDDMGFKNLEWRKGGEGISSTDGGRDLEATFTKIEPGDRVELEKWWIEVKYRSKNLSPRIVKESVLNSVGRDGVDVFTIVTSGTISNNTLDWIKDFQSNHSTPRIRIWQRHDIERILRKYPQITSRFFDIAMTLSERIEVVESQFWNHVMLPTLDEIDNAYKQYSNLQWSGTNLLPFMVAEASAGYPEFRKWGLITTEELLLETFIIGLANIPQLIVRFKQYGRSNKPLIDGLAYILEIALLRLNLDYLLNVISNPYNVMEGEIDPPPEFLNFIWEPILSNMFLDLGLSCSIDCDKVSWGDDEERHSFSFFSRFFSHKSEILPKDDEPFVVIQISSLDCVIDLVPDGEYCSLSTDIPENCSDKNELKKLLSFAQQVIQSRVEYIIERRDDTGYR